MIDVINEETVFAITINTVWETKMTRIAEVGATTRDTSTLISKSLLLLVNQ